LKKALIVILVICAAIASAQSKRQVAVLPSVADANALDPEGQIILTDKVREIASKNLPQDRFTLLKQDVITNRLGGDEELYNTCKEGVCIAELTKRISADYGARCDIMKRGDDLAMKFELYSVRDEAILETFTKYPAKDLFEMLAELEARLPDAFKKMIPATRNVPAQSLISNVEYGGNSYTVSMNTVPEGADLNFNGIISGHAKSPCRIELPEGDFRILAVLANYETVDTIITINRNNQLINIKLKPMGTLKVILPILDNKNWNFSINGKTYSTYENRIALVPGNYMVKLSHKCYEDINFNAEIIRGVDRVFDYFAHDRKKTGILVLTAKKDGNPVSEPVFLNGRRVGTTPFGSTVPVCAEITIGNDREKVNVAVKYNQTTKHTHIIPSKTPTTATN